MIFPEINKKQLSLYYIVKKINVEDLYKKSIKNIDIHFVNNDKKETIRLVENYKIKYSLMCKLINLSVIITEKLRGRYYGGTYININEELYEKSLK